MSPFKATTLSNYSMKCGSCGSRHMRPSNLRVSDVPKFLVLRLPVRCIICGERDHCGLLALFELRARRLRNTSTFR
jgi:hypothetical protein